MHVRKYKIIWIETNTGSRKRALIINYSWLQTHWSHKRTDIVPQCEVKSTHTYTCSHYYVNCSENTFIYVPIVTLYSDHNDTFRKFYLIFYNKKKKCGTNWLFCGTIWLLSGTIWLGTIWPWNELTGYLIYMYMYPLVVDLEGTALPTMINLNTYLFVLFCLFIYSYFVSRCDMVDHFLAQ